MTEKALVTREPLDISEKVTAATAAVAVATIGVWIVEASAGIDIPQLAEAAIATVLVFFSGYLKRDKLPA